MNATATRAESPRKALDLPLKALVHAQLARGEFRSGADLARDLGVSRSAIWKSVVALRALDVTIYAVRNRGYRLATPTELLDAERIRSAMEASVARRIRRLEVLWSVGSTNALLLERADGRPGIVDVLLAEHQSAGRGRQGRVWLAPPGGALCLSLAWSFARMPRDLAALGIGVGVWVLRVLGRRVREPIGLKWPNDLTVADRKLGGILIEMRAESGSPARVVIGIGINLALGPETLAKIAATGARATDLRSAGADPSARNAIAGEIITEVVHGLETFEHEGIAPFLEEWKAADALRGRLVGVHAGSAHTRGIARGIDTDGALLLETRTGITRLVSGEVSVRPEN